MKTRVLIIGLFLTCIVLTICWLRDRQSFKVRMDRAVEREAILRRDLMHAIHWTTLPYLQQTMPPANYEQLRTEMLAGVVVDCWLILGCIGAEDIYDETDRQALQQSAESALMQLRISNDNAFRDLLVELKMKLARSNLDWETVVVLVDGNENLNSDLAIFVNENVANRNPNVR